MDNRTMMELDPKLDGQFNELVRHREQLTRIYI